MPSSEVRFPRISGASGFKARARRAKPNTPVEKSIRNVAYALLSGADGWMFDGEDALGQISTMSLDNQRNLKLAIHRDPVFMKAAEQVAGEMNHGRRASSDARRSTIGRSSSTSRRRSSARAGSISTTGTSATPTAPAFPRPSSTRRSSSSTTSATCAGTGCSLVLYLPKIQTAEEAALWNDILAGARDNTWAFRSGRSRSTCSSSRSRRASN